MVDWSKTNLVPLAGLEAWHDAGQITGVANGGAVSSVPDSSGKGRTLTVSANKPTLNTNAINSNPSVVFSGSNNPLRYASSFTAKHFFVVAGYANATFHSLYPGLLSDTASLAVLIGDPGQSRFWDVTGQYGSAPTYRKRDVPIAFSAATASMSGVISIFEVEMVSSFTMGGIDVGRYIDLAGYDWVGPWCEHFIYSRSLTEYERIMMYQYFAMRYWIWQQTVAGLDVYPFPADKSRSQEFDIERYVSTPYTGSAKVLERGIPLSGYSSNYGLRRQEEFDAARQFWVTHRRPTECVYRDYRFYPPRDTKGIITSPLREQGSSVSMRFNYGFDFQET